MQLPNSPLGKFSKAYTLQRLIQLAYSFLFLGSHLKATQQWKVICQTYKRQDSGGQKKKRVLVSASHCWRPPLSFTPSGWNQEHFAAELHFPRHRLKSCNLPPQWSETPFGMFVRGFAFAESEAKCLFWILNMEKQASEFFPELLQQHIWIVRCEKQATTPGSSWCVSDAL